LLQALGKNNSVAGNRVVGYDHFTHRNSDPEAWPKVIGKFVVACHVGGLKGHGRGYGIRCSGEFSDEGIAPYFVSHALVLIDDIRKFPESILKPLMRKGFINSGKPRRVHDISVQQYCELSRLVSGQNVATELEFCLRLFDITPSRSPGKSLNEKQFSCG
jgi:hypothetical protein